MKRRWTIAMLAVVSPLLFAGCGERYSVGCKRSASVTSPWTQFKLPVDDGRVCDADSQRLHMEFVGHDQERWAQTIERAVMGAGYAKEKCPSYCIYTKDKTRLQVITGNIASKWVTVSMIMSH